MCELIDGGKRSGGSSETRNRKYQAYIPGDARVEGFCTIDELQERIECLEKTWLSSRRSSRREVMAKNSGGSPQEPGTAISAHAAVRQSSKIRTTPPPITPRLPTAEMA